MSNEEEQDMHNIKLGDCELSYEDVRWIELAQDCQTVCFGISSVETLVFTTRLLVWENVCLAISFNRKQMVVNLKKNPWCHIFVTSWLMSSVLTSLTISRTINREYLLDEGIAHKTCCMWKEGDDDDVNMAKPLHDFTSPIQEWNATQRPNRYSNTWNIALL